MKQLVKAGFERLGYRLSRLPPLASHTDYALEIDFEYVLAHYLARRGLEPPFFFVEVGAYDGVIHDRLHRHIVDGSWHGVLVEPQPQHFKSLVENYEGHDGLTFINAAIDRERGSRPLYLVQDNLGRPIDSLGGLASFSQERLLDWQRNDGHRAPAGSTIGTVPVTCSTFEDVLGDATYVDLLQIDVEGYELELLKVFDFARFSPAIVRFEHVHLSRTDWDEAVTLLANLDYRVLREEHDTTAYSAIESRKARTVQSWAGSRSSEDRD